MLVLNTNLYYDQNKQTTNMEDPAGQFSWADQILSQAATNKEKANSLFFFKLLDLQLLLFCHFLICFCSNLH